MRPVRSVIYCHGFSSSPASSKATRFRRELDMRSVEFFCPDFNAPDFETLTVTRMLDQTGRTIATAGASPTALIGSSLGAFVALHAAARDQRSTAPRVDRLILMAPALDFGGNRLRQLGEHGIDEWRRAGKLRVFHWGYNEPRDVRFALYEDAAHYDAFALELGLPMLVFQGTRDDQVDPIMVRRWASTRPNIDLRLLDDDHQLTASVNVIWTASAAFLAV